MECSKQVVLAFGPTGFWKCLDLLERVVQEKGGLEMEQGLETLKQMYHEMVFCRRFEEEAHRYAEKGVVPGFIHLGIGQEACQIGAVHALRRTDYKFPDHRCHGAIVFFGTDPKRVMAEIFGRRDGINRGRGGSMHISDLSVRNMGNNGIQGSSVLTALGTAFGARYLGTDDVTAAFLGDGTLGEGACHESLNMAATWKLPLVYIVVNNQYAISTHCRETHPQEQLADWARGYGVPGVVVDGNDVEAVFCAVSDAVERARRGEGPTVLELMTYRWQGHFAGDPAAYRPEEEVREWKKRCPIRRLEARLTGAGVPRQELQELEDRVETDMAEVVRFALDSPPPGRTESTRHVYRDRLVPGRD